MRQRTVLVMGLITGGFSELPMRQRTVLLGLPLLGAFSELPMRQRTWRCAQLAQQ